MTREEAATRLSMIFANCDTEMCNGAYACKYCDEAISMAIEALEQNPIHCKDCKHWHEWENGTGSCHRSNSIWVGTDYDDFCSFAD